MSIINYRIIKRTKIENESGTNKRQYVRSSVFPIANSSVLYVKSTCGFHMILLVSDTPISVYRTMAANG